MNLFERRQAPELLPIPLLKPGVVLVPPGVEHCRSYAISRIAGVFTPKCVCMPAFSPCAACLRSDAYDSAYRQDAAKKNAFATQGKFHGGPPQSNLAFLECTLRAKFRSLAGAGASTRKWPL